MIPNLVAVHGISEYVSKRGVEMSRLKKRPIRKKVEMLTKSTVWLKKEGECTSELSKTRILERLQKTAKMDDG